MHGRVAVLLLFVIGSVLSASLNKGTTGFNRKRWLIHGRPWHGLTPAPPAVFNPNVSPVQVITQPIDHDGSVSGTFQQQYWYNKQWHKKGGPAFLILGGEGPENGQWTGNPNLEWTSIGIKLGAMFFDIEHRYYGNSMPYTSPTSEQLKFLSSRQALADMANFIKEMNKKFGPFDKWIVFGGSYSGNLAAWAREKYPDLVFGSVASSAPVQAEVDFYQYLEVVELAFREIDPKCADNIHQSFVKLAKLAKTSAGKTSIKTLFNVCQDLNTASPDDITQFWGSIIGNFMGVVQYGGDNAGPYRTEVTPQVVCQMMNNKNYDVLSRLANVNVWSMQNNGEECVDISYDNYIKYMKDPHADRSWTWQTCTEFGYYQTTDSKTAGPFFGDGNGAFMPIKLSVEECTQIFGTAYASSQEVNQAIKDTNKYYGGAKNIKTTRIVFPNGSHDPWHALGMLDQYSSESPAILINGTAHCADMYNDSPGDLPGLTKARNQIRKTVWGWFNQ
ncbi:hypothetical protein L596_017012 [Steinernema carpocapsae]|uniref:Serine protease K12H4.7 n=1 Tax=Steinernema carpocapsae TaxID=34508 RepID=A0A4U5N082_STECR|nr:hypothetical protein L596_017012 [Steinernema carpocapsae]